MNFLANSILNNNIVHVNITFYVNVLNINDNFGHCWVSSTDCT